MKRLALALMFAVPCWSAGDLHFFESRVRPLLAERCFACHTDSEMGGLRLDSLERALQGGSRGAAIIPGDPVGSLLLTAVRRTRDDLKMPPSEALAASEIEVLEQWIDRGAAWGDTARPVAPTAGVTRQSRQFWAFRPVRRPRVPSADVAGAIDAFLKDRLSEAGLEPAPAADRRTLIRRVSFDLLGLPPSPAETAAFLADDAPAAYRRLVDRLLGSPHYGERMARRWLDLARYADGQSAAYADTPLTNAWRYRDWVVEAFNRDLPYDRFIVFQLAADLESGAWARRESGCAGFSRLAGP